MDLTSIPNNVSGDGRVFVKQLKNYLGVTIEDNEQLVDTNDTGSYCQSLSWVNLTQEQEAGVNRIRVSWDKASVYAFKDATVFYKPVSTSAFSVAGVTESNEFVINNVDTVRYAVKVVPTNLDGGYDKSPNTYYIDIVKSMTTPNPPEQFVVIFDSGEGHWSWKYEGVYDFFELRTDTNVGVTSEALLARTTDKYAVKEPNVAHGTAYLYVRNSFGIYSAPAVHGFDITSLGVPPKPTISRGYNGVNIHMDDKGDNDYYVVQVEETIYDNIDKNPFYIERTRGAMRVRYCYKKDGVNKAWSNWGIFNISELIDTDDLCDNCITADKISAGSVTVDKLFAGNIDLMGKLAIVGGAVTVNENGLTCISDNDGDSVVFDGDGMNFLDSRGNKYASVGRLIIGEAKHGDRVAFRTPWNSTPYVLVMPQQFQTNYIGFNTAALETVCQAVNVSNEGFGIECFTRLLGGSSGTLGGFDIGEKTDGISGQVGTTKTVPVPNGATSLTIRFSADCFASVNAESNSDSDGDFIYGYGRTSVMFELLVNGVVVSTYTSPTISGNKVNKESFSSSFSIRFNQGDAISIRAMATFSQSGTLHGAPAGNVRNAKVTEFSFDIAAGQSQVIGTGKATFIALEKLNADYSIEGGAL